MTTTLQDPRPRRQGATADRLIQYARLAVIAAAAALLAPASLPGAGRETLTALFGQANAFYQSGDFISAERCYRQLAEKGVDSGELFYNLGNACFKQKKLGEAIYFWQKARRRLPADPDVAENLDLAGLLVVDRIDVPADPLPLRWFERAIHRLSLNRITATALILWLLMNALWAAYRLAGSRRSALRALLLATVAGSLCVLLSCLLGWRVYEENTRQEGVVIEEKADVRSGPGTENVTVFTVHEGILVGIRGETAGWYQINLPNGWSGWLQSNAVRALD